MPIILKGGIITRDMLRAEPTALWLFGDNMLQQGFGGQAKEMRGEPNALGIATKWAPGTASDDYLAPGDLHDARFRQRMNTDFAVIMTVLRLKGTVYLPGSGIGTGLSQLKERAPNILEAITSKLDALALEYRDGEKL